MKKQLSVERVAVSINASKPLQNCYLIPRVPNCDNMTCNESKTYFELQREPTSDFVGIQEKLVEVDYPITPESVNSYLPDTIYQRDLANASTRVVQYGDITGIQSILERDLSESIAVYEQTLAKLRACKEAASKSASDAKKNEVEKEV